MSTKTQPNTLPGDRRNPPETRLTWDELAKLGVIVSVDLLLLERANTPENPLGEMIATNRKLLAKLEVMRLEAYRREHP